MAAEMELMSSRGHHVLLAGKDNAAIDSFLAKAKSAMDVAYSKEGRLWMKKELMHFRPDVVHVHNFFPLLSPSIYDACLESKTPVIQTLHNFRIVCAGGLLLRDGAVCEDCLQGSPYNAVLHRCYRRSFLGSLAVARMVKINRDQGTWGNKINQIIALTEFAKSKFVEAGIPADRITVKPNFVEDVRVGSTNESQNRNGAIFVGRLSEEKGIATLAKAWQKLDIPLRIAGDGPLKMLIASLPENSVNLLGRLDRKKVFKAMEQAEFLVMPSECYEGFPLVLAEAFMLGLPVIASRLGSMAEIIEDGVTGKLFEPGNPRELANHVLWMHEHPEECRQMGLNARKAYEERYTAARNHELLLSIYQEAMKDSQRAIHC